MSIPVTGTNHYISLTTAVSMTTTYRSNMETILDSNYKNQEILAVCETFDVTAIQALISQSECQGLRVYFGMDDDNKVHVILVGVNNNDEDILPTGEEKIVEMGLRCPKSCPPKSPLNS